MSDEILQAIPHRPPFLFVDEIVEREDNRIHCRKKFTGDEFFYQGHYPTFPLTPGVLLCEAAMQAGAILLSHVAPSDASKVPVATRIHNVRFKQMVRPGDTIDMQVSITERLADAFFLQAKVTCRGKSAVTFDFACTLAPPPSDAATS